MKIKTATFVKSCAEIGQCPNGELLEYAFIGRSNVGKSSLIIAKDLIILYLNSIYYTPILNILNFLIIIRKNLVI